MPAPTAEQQQRWRKHAVASITVHLTREDAATLDAIAIMLWQQYPHDPPNGWENPDIHPSRPEAVRALCAAWRAQHGSPHDSELVTKRLRTALSAFWRHETSWRQTKSGTFAERPRPPWPRLVLSVFEALPKRFRGLPRANPQLL